MSSKSFRYNGHYTTFVFHAWHSKLDILTTFLALVNETRSSARVSAMVIKVLITVACLFHLS